ncbi:DUF3429 domain-containing protein [Motiliproteus sp. SC1-56]|uniref:DUF3429 domain-containing protein n=1 Tax=Motiliproteus sp. SC1-56 TaxID=2799565 RepID=UPI001A8C628F
MLWQRLGYAGLLPFVFALAAQGLGWPASPSELSPARVFIAYSAIILSFLGGTLWGREIDRFPHSARALALWASNGFALLGFAALLCAELQLATVLLGLGFAALFYTELRYLGLRSEAGSYQRLRRNLTGVVCLLHAVLLVMLTRG